MEIKLNSLLEVTKAINTNASTVELLDIFRKVAVEKLNIGRLVLFVNDNEWKCVLKFGTPDIPELNIDKDLTGIKEITYLSLAEGIQIPEFDVIVPVFHKATPLAYVLIGDLNEESISVSPIIKHLPFIQTLTNIIVVAIENKKLFRENIKQAAMQKELELASQMQSLLFPSSLPSDEVMDISAFYFPHRQVGGDYYDFVRLNENEIILCMADVSGKGVPAALLMSNFQANLRSKLSHIQSLTDLVKELNHVVMQNAKGEKFITLFIARYNQVTRTLNYINAGHNPPIVYSGNATTFLKTGCTGLGMFPELPRIREGLVTLLPSTTLLCYTDGVVEVSDEEGNEFGTESLEKIMLNSAELTMAELNTIVIRGIDRHRRSMPYIDDITLLSCRFF